MHSEDNSTIVFIKNLMKIQWQTLKEWRRIKWGERMEFLAHIVIWYCFVVGGVIYFFYSVYQNVWGNGNV